MEEQEERVDRADGPMSASSLHLEAVGQWVAYLAEVRWGEAAYRGKLLRVVFVVVVDRVGGDAYRVAVDEFVIDDHFRDSRQEVFPGSLRLREAVLDPGDVGNVCRGFPWGCW
jgi:hypothetical protein